MLEIAFFIQLFTLLAVLPTVPGRGTGGLRTTRQRLYLARGCSTAFHSPCLTFALSLLTVDSPSIEGGARRR